MGTDTNSNFFAKLASYFQIQAIKLETARNSTKIHENPSDKGTMREDSFFDFLQNHLPTRCNIIKGGFVFDSIGNRSEQIDIMVTNDQTFQFKESSEDKKTKQFNCVEGCYAVISVKSYLGKKELHDSLDNLSSVSTHKKIRVSPFVRNKDVLIRQIPERIIFSYQGDQADTTKKNLEEYLSTHTAEEQNPGMIIVNNKFYFSRGGVQGSSKIRRDGLFLKPNEYAFYEGPYAGSASLYTLISRIQTLSVNSTHMEIDFDAYGDAIEDALFQLTSGIK